MDRAVCPALNASSFLLGGHGWRGPSTQDSVVSGTVMTVSQTSGPTFHPE